MTNRNESGVSLFGIKIRSSSKLSFLFAAIIVSFGILAIVGYRQMPTELAIPRCHKYDDSRRFYSYEHDLNERFALAFATYLMHEGMRVRFDKETSTVWIAPADAYWAPYIRASKNAAEALLYGLDTKSSVLRANRGDRAKVTCEQVKLLSVK